MFYKIMSMLVRNYVDLFKHYRKKKLDTCIRGYAYLKKNAKVKRIKKKNTVRNCENFIRHSDTSLFISRFNKTVHFVHFITKSNKVLIKVDHHG